MSKILLFLMLNLIILPSYSIETYPKVKLYIDSLTQDLSSILNESNITEPVKITKSQKLLVDNLDLEWMAKYTLGRYKRSLNPKQIDEFIKIYSKHITLTYTDLIKNYKEERSEIININKIDDNEFIVKTEIIKVRGQPPTRVDYFVRQISNGNQSIYRISDVITEGVSMINSQQAEFANILENNGFDVLITELKKSVKNNEFY